MSINVTPMLHMCSSWLITELVLHLCYRLGLSVFIFSVYHYSAGAPTVPVNQSKHVVVEATTCEEESKRYDLYTCVLVLDTFVVIHGNFLAFSTEG